MNLNNLRCKKCSGSIDENKNGNSELFCIFCGTEYSYSDFSQNSVVKTYEKSKSKEKRRSQEPNNQISNDAPIFPQILKLARFIPIVAFIISIALSFLATKPDDPSHQSGKEIEEQVNEPVSSIESIDITSRQFDGSRASIPIFYKKLTNAKLPIEVSILSTREYSTNKYIFGLVKNIGTKRIIVGDLEIYSISPTGSKLKFDYPYFTKYSIAPSEEVYFSIVTDPSNTDTKFDVVSKATLDTETETHEELVLSSLRMVKKDDGFPKFQAKLMNINKKPIKDVPITLYLFNSKNQPFLEILSNTNIDTIDSLSEVDVTFESYANLEDESFTYKIISGGKY
ncbi:MAG: hypothetical protein SFU98_08320 [Leptospiraceae bacterium]|nr:hypothetical protein [Leptospiraceae bacterium]